MKNLFLLLTLMFFASVLLTAQQVIVTDDAAHTTPSTGAMLDVFSANKGFLPPQVALTAANAASPITSPSTGLIVYNTATAGTSPNNVTPGYYYNSGTAGSPVWNRLMNTDLTNGITIQDDGSFLLNGTATLFNDLVVPSYAGFSSSTNPPTMTVMLGNKVMAQFFANTENPAQEQQVFFSVQMPHDWKEGTTIYPHVHWSPQTASGTNIAVVWGFEFSWQNYVAAGPVAFPATSIITGTSGTFSSGDVDKHYITTLPAITASVPTGNTVSGKKLSSMLMCRFFRNSSNGADTYTGDAAFLSFDIHYEIDALGSRLEYIK